MPSYNMESKFTQEPSKAYNDNYSKIFGKKGKEMTRDEMINELREGVCTVTFTKKNGEERIMDCTLDMNVIPEADKPKTDGNVSEGVEATISAVKVYDVKASGWRSFLVDNVSKFKKNEFFS